MAWWSPWKRSEGMWLLGTGLVTLEAMKMENELKAHGDGTVKSVSVAQGGEVSQGKVLFVPG